MIYTLIQVVSSGVPVHFVNFTTTGNWKGQKSRRQFLSKQKQLRRMAVWSHIPMVIFQERS